MKHIIFLSYIGVLFFGTARAQVTFYKIDTTVKVGKTGYRVDCKNKKPDQNELGIKLVGFENGARDMGFVISGRLAKAEIEDLNSDGFPDLVLYIYGGANSVFGTVYVFISQENKSIVPCVLPDIMMDGKANTGYKGHDQFSIMGSYLQQKFPIYKTSDTEDKPTGGTRVVLYQLVKSGESGFKFNKVRSYDEQ